MLLILPISVALALPSPAVALRQRNVGMEHSPVQRELREHFGASAGSEELSATRPAVARLADVVLDWVTVKPIREYREVPCALCDRADYQPVGLVRINREDFQIVECPHDGLMWLNPQPDAAYYEQLYSEPFFKAPDGLGARLGLQYDRPDVLQRRRRDAQLQVEEWARDGDRAPPGRLLELGGGGGLLSKAAQDKGWRVLNVELSAYAATLSRESGVPTYTGTLEQAMAAGVVQDGGYDLVAAYALIEHLPDPNGFLARVRRALNNEGILAVRIPVTPATGPRLSLVEHVYHYTPGTFTQMLRKHGFLVTHQHHSGTFGDAQGHRSDAYTFFARKLGSRAGIRAAGLEETVKVLDEAAQGPGVVVVDARILSQRIGLEEFLARAPTLARRVVLYRSDDPRELALTLMGLEAADTVAVLGDAGMASALRRYLPASMTVRAVSPTTGLEELLALLGVPRDLLQRVNAGGLEEQLALLHAA